MTITFGQGDNLTTVVDGLTFDLRAGETLALVGESGSGKSVSTLAAVGLIAARGGSLRSGKSLYRAASGETLDLTRTPERLLRRVRGLEIGLVFQEPMTSLNPVFPIGRQISDAARYHQGISDSAARALALDMLNRVRIADAEKRLDQYPHEFSGGMRQRAMIAMALSCNPRLLIADEPTTALDVTVQAEILSLIKHLQKDLGTSVLFISHDLSVVSEMSDRVVIMKEGKKVEEGSAVDVLLRPQATYTRNLLSVVPKLGETRDSAGPVRIPIIDQEGARPDAVPAKASPPADPNSGPLLKVVDLTKTYQMRKGLLRRIVGEVHAARSVSFEIDRGRTLGLVGESGSGKSTVGRCILRLIEPDAGSVMVDGTDVTKLTHREMDRLRGELQIVFQDPYASLNPRKTAGNIVGEPLIIHRGATGTELEDRVAWLFEKVGLLPEHMDRYPHEFSGGQRQRIGIARAIALNPKLIVGDEPVSALDVSVRAQIVNLMIDLQEEFGISYLFISHDMAVVERMSHDIAVMRAGEIVEIGDRRKVLSDPRHPYTQKLISAVPAIDPGRRARFRPLSVDTPVSALRPPNWSPKPIRYEAASSNHKFAVGD
ncbi:ABC transporter ATP-binding protein [Pikeienuella piscinae]|uniref:Glutathione import ATP-binding protein GsiA n=1 Tax=Pikeienuella piscinae TaxID=2748098 RepID=A0A7L5BTU3_9RHOB|nr:ABC transporter ATP-binding protein [Pikeienuella piscinae]QIE55095.1 ABC transporter ATP-binding protein [Pikeienuella piscinae]